ncbi:glycosyl hydrolase family 5 protein/cellulase [Corynespora cassiicola Philippines]|uniref:Glycosyl hydrolase family 5 protein/cellulase n=1 Tax=Corynespora cassiicola Philippines TaxID=1448308 RepID=A0A2T2NFF7_CORCC|nr:glycosyl hydrolase family 5 protein/cellulase [Corynespora cassiicola Philippines]
MWAQKCASIALLSLSLAASASATVLHTSSRWILNEQNERVKLRCANWAGHMEVNIPEGLQHQSASYIAEWVASNGFNCVRLTYSIDLALSPDYTVADSFSRAADPAGVSAETMQGLYDSAVEKNPWLASSTTLGAFARVIEELEKVGVLVVLDNHNSRAGWCCSMSDGNGWWDEASGYDPTNSQYFNTQNWLDGLAAMARFSASHPNVVGMALRNELRATGSQDGNNHADWYNFVAQGSSAVHDANQDLLIVVGGVSYATDMSFIGANPFDRSPYPNKVVWEFHNYEWSLSGSTCEARQAYMGNGAGYLLTQGQPYTGPLWLSEFGWALSNPTPAEDTYVRCLIDYLEGNDAEWAYWAIMGSYYVRDQQANYDESFGLLDREWNDWRNSTTPRLLAGIFAVTQGP